MMADEGTSSCPECGAALESGRTCRDYFHDLLALEAEVRDAPGAEPHFLAVAAYNLQHPAGFLPAALAGLRQAVSDVLARRATLADVRRRAGAAAAGPARVRRRPDAAPTEADRAAWREWPGGWAMTVRDVCGVAPEEYGERVRAWATAVTAALDRPASGARAG